MPLTPIRLIGFPTGTQLPLVVAQRQGFFAARDLDVTLTATPGAVYQFEQLSAGHFELAMTALDNVIAYDEGQTPATLPNPPDFVVIMGGDGSAPALWARPEIASYADLRGKTLAVDSVSSGFSFLLRGMLERHGVLPNEYGLTGVGTTAHRLAAMKAGTAAAALLDAAFAAAAATEGFRLLQTGNDAVGPYGAFSIAGRRSWLDANRDVAVRFVNAVLAGIAWMLLPANRGESHMLLAQHLKLSLQEAEPILAQLLDPTYGFSTTGAIPPQALKTILAFREAYGEPKKTLGDPGKYYDPSFLRQAGGG